MEFQTNNQATHIINGREVLFVETDKGTREFEITSNVLRCFAPYNKINIPPGPWKLIGTSDSMSEEQASELVEDYGGKIFDHDPKHYFMYEDYTLKDHPFDSNKFEKATESLQSLFRSLGLDPINNTIVILEKEK